MSGMRFLGCCGIGLALVAALVISFNTHTLVEYLRPTTIVLMPLPKDCVPSNEAPPANLMRIVKIQQAAYRLALQKVVVCKKPGPFPKDESEFANAFFDSETREQWLPLYVGCCSYRFGRHSAVVVAENSVVVEAALIQSRWDFFWQRLRLP